MIKLFRSIKGRLIVAFIILISFSFILLGLALKYPIENYFMENIEDNLFSNTVIIRDFIAPEIFSSTLQDEKILEFDRIIKEIASQIEVRITVISINGEVIADSHESAAVMDNHGSRPEVKQAVQQGKAASYKRYSSTIETDMMYMAVPVERNGELMGIVRLALPLNHVHQTIGRISKMINLSILLITLLSLIVSVRLTTSITRPVEKLNSTARKIADGRWNERAFSGTDDEIGGLADSFNYMTDILQEKIVELKTSKGKLEAVINNMSSGVMVITPQETLEMANPAAADFLGITDVNFSDKQSYKVFRIYELTSKIEEALLKQERIKCVLNVSEPYFRTLGTDLIPVMVSEKITALIVVMHDITELQKLTQLKTEFVSNASHELRTPLTSIKGFAETLLDGAMADPSSNEKFIRIIDLEAERLIRITDSLLDLTWAEQKNTIEKKLVDIKKIIENVISSINFKILEKKLDLIIEIPSELPLVGANEDAVTVIILNLLDNAIKYTFYNPKGSKKGKIEIKGKIGIKVTPSDSHIKIEVWDTGIGIPKEDLPRVFERFYRVDRARSRTKGGTGLGLAIVKHLVEAHQGEVGVNSKQNKGSTFWVALPLKNKRYRL